MEIIERDSRIEDILGLIDSGNYDLLCLDVFDTVVWRMVPKPKDVFFILADRLIQMGGMHDSSTPESFVKLRVSSEDRARRKKSYTTEVTLDEIYAEFPMGYLTGITPKDVMKLEYEVEKELVFVYPEMESLIGYVRERGMKTSFVSDTYFSSDEVQELAGTNPDYCIVSCEHNVSKYQGLHRVLLELSGVKPSRILHVGDNYEADIEGPAVFNINRYWFQKFPREYGNLPDEELPETYSQRSKFFPSHDCGLTFLRSRTAFACSTDYERWGALILGPIVSGFADWVAQKCETHSLNTALCLMREGRVFKNVLDLYGIRIETQEFFISRYTALKASLYDCTEEELKYFIFRPSRQNTHTILEQLGLDDSDIVGDYSDILSLQAATGLIRRITANPMLKRKVTASSKRMRVRLLKHLASMVNLKKPQKVAVVDLGYKGTIQNCLQRIFAKENIPIITHGLYLVTGGEVFQTQSTGAVVEGWLAENDQPVGMAHSFMRSPEIVEQSLMTDFGTTIGYDDYGEPELTEIFIPEEQQRQIQDIQKGMMTFCRSWVEHKTRYGIGDTAHLKRWYQSICIRSVARPFPVELELFGKWRHDENFGSAKVRALIDADMDEWEMSHISAHQLASLPSSRVYWPFGLARSVSEAMGEAVAHIFMRTAKPDVFDVSMEKKTIVFYWDTGNGFTADNSTIEEYVLNNRNRLWKRFGLKLDRSDNRHVGFSIGLVGEVLQFTGIIIHYHPEEGEAKRVRFSHDMIEKSGYRHLHNNLYLVSEDPPLLVVPTDNARAFTGQIDVDIFFSLVTGDGNG